MLVLTAVIGLRAAFARRWLALGTVLLHVVQGRETLLYGTNQVTLHTVAVLTRVLGGDEGPVRVKLSIEEAANRAREHGGGGEDDRGVPRHDRSGGRHQTFLTLVISCKQKKEKINVSGV